MAVRSNGGRRRILKFGAVGLCLALFASAMTVTTPAAAAQLEEPAINSGFFGSSLSAGDSAGRAGVSAFGSAAAVLLADDGDKCERTETTQQTTTEQRTGTRQATDPLYDTPLFNDDGSPQMESYDEEVQVTVSVDETITGTWRTEIVDGDSFDGDDDDQWVGAFQSLVASASGMEGEPGVRYHIRLCVRDGASEVMEAEWVNPGLPDQRQIAAGLGDALQGDDGLATKAASNWIEQTVVRWDSQPARNHHQVVGLPTWFWVPPEDWPNEISASASTDDVSVPASVDLRDDEVMIVTATATQTGTRFAWDAENGGSGEVSCPGAPYVWAPGSFDESDCSVEWPNSSAILGDIEIKAVGEWDLTFLAEVYFKDGSFDVSESDQQSEDKVNQIWEHTDSGIDGLWDVANDGSVPDSHKLQIAEVLTFGFDGTALDPTVDPPAGPTAGGQQIGAPGCSWYAVLCHIGSVVIDIVLFLVPDFILEAIDACADAIGTEISNIFDSLKSLNPAEWSGMISDFNDTRKSLQQAHTEGKLVELLTDMGQGAATELLKLEEIQDTDGNWDFSGTNVVRWISALSCSLMFQAFTGGAAAKLASVARKARTWLRDKSGKPGGVRDSDVDGTTCSFVTPSSFPAGTPVLMADGSYTAIDLIWPGDDVIAYDLETETWGAQEVLDQWSHPDTGALSTVELVDGTTVTATDDHRFWVATTQTWTELQFVQPGHALLAPTGLVTVAAVSTTAPQNSTVWELSVANDDNFTVSTGTSDLLVHNAKPPCGQSDIDAIDAQHKPNRDQVDYSDLDDYEFLRSDPKKNYRNDPPATGFKGGWRDAPNPKKWTDDGGEVFELDGGLVFVDKNGVAVHYNADGYPDFGPHATAEVSIQMPNNPDGTCCKQPSHDGTDFALANDGVGKGPDWGNQSPEGYTWHHGSCTASGSCTMQLLPTDIHDGFSHQGAVSLGLPGE